VFFFLEHPEKIVITTTEKNAIFKNLDMITIYKGTKNFGNTKIKALYHLFTIPNKRPQALLFGFGVQFFETCQ
jgi:hypothetical protein